MGRAFPGAIIALLLPSFPRLPQLPHIYTPYQASKALEFVNINFLCLSENRNNKSVSYPFPFHLRSVSQEILHRQWGLREACSSYRGLIVSRCNTGRTGLGMNRLGPRCQLHPWLLYPEPPILHLLSRFCGDQQKHLAQGSTQRELNKC